MGIRRVFRFPHRDRGHRTVDVHGNDARWCDDSDRDANFEREIAYCSGMETPTFFKVCFTGALFLFKFNFGGTSKKKRPR